jgi:hypothetical protein
MAFGVSGAVVDFVIVNRLVFGAEIIIFFHCNLRHQLNILLFSISGFDDCI